jgi:hypothetical protein
MSLKLLTSTMLEKLTRFGSLCCSVLGMILSDRLRGMSGQLSGSGIDGSNGRESGGLGGGRAPLGPGPTFQADPAAWRQLVIQAPKSDFCCCESWLSGKCVSFMLHVL